jgi:hypothetical protein
MSIPNPFHTQKLDELAMITMFSSAIIYLTYMAASVSGAAISIPTFSAILSGYTGADVDFPQTPSPLGPLPVIPPTGVSQVEAQETSVPKAGEPGAAPSRVGQYFTGPTSHGPYRGPYATTTGALENSPAASSIMPKGPNPTATYYNPQGDLLQQQPAPYVPAGRLTPII